MTSISCPALFLTAPASGQGKTTITAALARFHARQGRVVRVFKTGPDYLDPQVLESASGQPVVQLDLWMAGPAYCRQKLYEAAQVADLILIEGAMGMFDGKPSSADLAATFGIPIVIVLDVKGMAQTAAAVATGLANFRDDYSVRGLIANNCGSDYHAQLIRESLPADLPLLANLKREPEVALPERHLGLVQPSEQSGDLDQRFETGADRLAGSALTELPPPVEFDEQDLPPPPALLQGKRIGIARDAAFSFVYEANLQLLRDMGAEIRFFSPLSDSELPVVDALWLPGGYPELHTARLAANQPMLEAIRDLFNDDKPIFAECGGLLYCLQTLTDLDGVVYPMLGLLTGHGAMRGKRGCQGMQTAVFPEGEVRAHAHHRSRSSGTPEPIGFGRRMRHAAQGEAIYRSRSLTASYLHLFFPSNPEAVASLLSESLLSTTNESVINES